MLNIKTAILKDDILLMTYMIIFSIKYFTNIFPTYITVFLSFIGVYIFIYTYNKFFYIRNTIYMFIMINVFALVGIIISQKHNLIYFLLLIAYEGYGLLLYCTISNYKAIKIYSSLLFAYILFKSIFLYIHGKPITLSALSGQNTVSILILMIYFLDILYREKNKKKLNYLIYLTGLFIAILCGGSGGMLCLAIFPILIFMCKKYGTKLSKSKILFIILGAFTVFLGLGYINEFIEIISDDNSRFWIWSHYGELAVSSMTNFIFGASVDSIPFLSRLRNMHNTFINIHYYYGLIPFVFFIYIIVVTGVNLWKQKEFYFLSILLVTLLRAFTDATEFCFFSIWIFLYCKSTLTTKKNNFFRLLNHSS